MQAEVALSPQYNGALLRGGLVAALLLGLSSLVLNGGLAIQVALMTSLGYLGCNSHISLVWLSDLRVIRVHACGAIT